MTREGDERRAQLDARLRAQRGRRARPAVIADVERLTGARPDLDDFLAADATDRLATRYLGASSRPGRQRQTWSTEAKAEMTRVVATISWRLTGVEAYWLHRLSDEAGAVRVDAGAVLQHVDFYEGDYDLVLVTDHADDGLRLAWDHLPDGDEFELVRWGSFRPGPHCSFPWRLSQKPLQLRSVAAWWEAEASPDPGFGSEFPTTAGSASSGAGGCPPVA